MSDSTNNARTGKVIVGVVLAGLFFYLDPFSLFRYQRTGCPAGYLVKDTRKNRYYFEPRNDLPPRAGYVTLSGAYFENFHGPANCAVYEVRGANGETRLSIGQVPGASVPPGDTGYRPSPQRRCFRCNGSGRISCHICFGNPRLRTGGSCHGCSNAGDVRCSSCSGSGSR